MRLCHELILVHPCDYPPNLNGRCDFRCVKNGPSAKCECDAGYELGLDGKKCIFGKSIYLFVFYPFSHR